MEIEEVEPNTKLEWTKLILDFVLIILVLIFIVAIIYLIVIFKKDAFQCLQDPVLYYQQMKNVSCQCSVMPSWEVIFP